MTDNIEIPLKDGDKVILPQGTKIVSDFGPTTVYETPAGRKVEVDYAQGTVENVTLNKRLGELRR